MEQRVWVNGHPCAEVSVDDRGLCYGDGLFETMRIVAGHIPLWSWHRKRLLRGLDRIALPMDVAQLDEQVFHHAALAEDAVMRLMVTRGMGQRGYWPSETPQPTLITALHPYTPMPREWRSEGTCAALLQQRLGSSSLLGGMKHLNRLEQVLLRRELTTLPGCQEALVMDAYDRVIEGVSHNVFLVKNYVLHTPEIQDCGVSGVMRSVLMEMARTVRIPSRVRVLSVDDFLEADEIFFCNSIQGIMPVRELLGRQYRIGAVILKLQAEVDKVFANGSAKSPAQI